MRIVLGQKQSTKPYEPSANFTRCSKAACVTVSTPETSKNSFRNDWACDFSSNAVLHHLENAVAALRISFQLFTNIPNRPLLLDPLCPAHYATSTFNRASA